MARLKSLKHIWIDNKMADLKVTKIFGKIKKKIEIIKNVLVEI
jgi:hypothetical protein